MFASGHLKEGEMYDVDFDHQFIETEKYDAKPTYKKFLGYRLSLIHIFTNFNDANGGLAGYDPEDIDGVLEDAITRKKKRLNDAKEAYDACLLYTSRCV